MVRGLLQMKKTYTGSYHCGVARFEAEIDLRVRTFARGYAEAIGGEYLGIQLAALDKIDP